MMICLRGTRSRPTGAHHASEGRTVSAGLPALLEAASRVVPFIACAIGISCARSCKVQCPISDERSPRMQSAPIAMGSKVNAKFSMLCLLKREQTPGSSRLTRVFLFPTEQGSFGLRLWLFPGQLL